MPLRNPSAKGQFQLPMSSSVLALNTGSKKCQTTDTVLHADISLTPGDDVNPKQKNHEKKYD